MTAAELAALLPARVAKPQAIEERDFRNHWSMFGTPAVVNRVGRHWTVWGGRLGHGVYRTKREAMEMATRQAKAIGRRAAEAR